MHIPQFSCFHDCTLSSEIRDGHIFPLYPTEVKNTIKRIWNAKSSHHYYFSWAGYLLDMPHSSNGYWNDHIYFSKYASNIRHILAPIIHCWLESIFVLITHWVEIPQRWLFWTWRGNFNKQRMQRKGWLMDLQWVNTHVLIWQKHIVLMSHMPLLWHAQSLQEMDECGGEIHLANSLYTVQNIARP